MPRASNTRTARPERHNGCLRVRFGSRGEARKVCRIQSYVRTHHCTRTQMTRVLVHWFDPRCMRVVLVAGRMH